MIFEDSSELLARGAAQRRMAPRSADRAAKTGHAELVVDLVAPVDPFSPTPERMSLIGILRQFVYIGRKEINLTHLIH
jgi:hypothetical protein